MLTTIWCTMVRGDVRLFIRGADFILESAVCVLYSRGTCHPLWKVTLSLGSVFHTHTILSFGLFYNIQIFSLLHLLFLYLFLSLQNSDMVPLIYGLFSIKKVPVMTYSLLFLYPANEAFWWEKRQRKDVNKRHREKKTQKRMQEGALNGHGWFHVALCGSSWLVLSHGCSFL